MKQGDEVRVKKQQTKQTVDYLKSEGIKPLSSGKILNVMDMDGGVFYMIEIIKYGKVISLPEDAVENIWDGLFDSDNPFGDLFGDIFKGKPK